jgi:acyl-CoA thioester hydrolase
MPATAAARPDPSAGVAERVDVHFDDLDAMGVVHNGRYALLLERALGAYWTRLGWSFDPSKPHFADLFFVVREFSIVYHAPITTVGAAEVRFWLDRLGSSSLVYGFEVRSADGSVLHAEGRRAQVRLDPATMRSAPISDTVREACLPLLRDRTVAA